MHFLLFTLHFNFKQWQKQDFSDFTAFIGDKVNI